MAPSRPPIRSPHHRHASLAKRAFPAVAVLGAAGSLVWVLDKPSTSALPADAAADDQGVGLDGATDSIDESIEPPDTDGTAVVDDAGSSSGDDESSSGAPATTQKKSSTKKKKSSTTTTTDAPASSTKKKSTPSSTSTTDAPPTTTKKTSGASCSPVTGSAVATRYGTIQVRISVSSSGKICSVKVVQYATGGRSGRIQSRAIPMLNQETMSAQGANIDGVSGATVTSRGYVKSLQAALDAAG